MKRSTLSTAALCWGVSLCFCACSTSNSKVTQSAVQPPSTELEAGVRYEVRPVLRAGSPFRSSSMTVYYFSLDAPANVTPEEELATAVASDGSLNVRTTAYCHDENDHIGYGKMNAAGSHLKFGNLCSAAADWSRYPLGTRFRIANQPDVVYEVDDYGSALVGSGTIDLYRPTMGSMNAWGVRNVDIEILEWGSYEDSMKLMRDRIHYPHVRRMFYDIQRKINQGATGKTSPVRMETVFSPAAEKSAVTTL
jgi:3D (Asp-Asp-Asp) domain-containing protein